MKKIIPIIFVSVIVTGCIKSSKDYKLNNEVFSTELIQLKDYFHIPGLSVIIRQGDQTVYENYIGFADMEKQIAIDSSTTIPMASLTKMFTGVLIMQLVDSKKISLDESINKYVSNEKIPDSLKIKHVLSHTSQGDVGQNFYYSGRFGWLTAVVEKAYQSTFEEVIQEKIIKPLGLKNTYLLKDSSQIYNDGRKIASPYFYEGKTKEGFIDYGYSAAAGITSTVSDLAGVQLFTVPLPTQVRTQRPMLLPMPLPTAIAQSRKAQKLNFHQVKPFKKPLDIWIEFNQLLYF